MENERDMDGVLVIEGTESKVEETNSFEKSYFHNEYQQAIKAVERIINNTLDRKEREDISAKIHNIVPFIGKRGVGKTSAMMSFANALKWYYDDIRKGRQVFDFYRRKNGREEYKLNVQFTCIDFIDGSLLENGEDIFKIILAQMYGEFLELDQRSYQKSKSYEFEKRELLQQFDKIYRNACELERGNNKDNFYEESAITSLKNLSSSLSVKAEFANMVQRYLKIFRANQQEYREKERSEKTEHFLVIMVDDLDLNINNGYDMLEKIHRYMMVDNIIVLLSADYDQVKLLCEKKFFGMVPKYDAKLNEKSADVEQLAQDFLDKVLPANMRIYMPELAKKMNVMAKTNGETENLKAAVFKRLLKKLGMRMDVDGVKRHFYEQNSLRAFISFYLMLEDMSELTEHNQMVLEQNYTILLHDTTTRMVDERLSYASKRKFERLTESKLPLSSRNLYIEASNEAQGKEQLDELRESLKHYGYSYGEILRIIYCLGRLDHEHKELMRCLLAFYSLELIREFYYYGKNGDNERRRKAADRLKDTVNGSLAGSWADKMFPKVISQKEYMGQKEFTLGIIKDLDMEKAFRFAAKDLLEGKAYIEIDETFDLEKEIPQVARVCRSILILGMFFEQQHYKTELGFDWKHMVIQEESADMGEGRNRKKLDAAGDSLVDIVEREIALEKGRGTFNIFNFVSNAMQYEENIKPLLESVYDAIAVGDTKDEMKGKILEATRIEEEFKKWHEYSKGFAIPLYDIDITYNVMKRLRQRELTKNTIESGAVLDNLKKVYKDVAEKLESNDNWYKDVGLKLKSFEEAGRVETDSIYFKEAFMCCPYMKWFFEAEKLIANFGDVFKQMVDNLPWSDGKTIEPKKDNVFMGYED